jgi:hypothetical protein
MRDTVGDYPRGNCPGLRRCHGARHEQLRDRAPEIGTDGTRHVREGEFPGDLIVIGFPSREAAVGWYESDGYREILPLRRDNADG